MSFRNEMEGLRMNKLFGAAAAAAVLILSSSAQAQAPLPAPASALSYADLADLGLSAPVAAHVRVTRATRLKDEQAAGVAAGRTRFYVEADVLSLIRGPSGLPAQLRYLAELPNRPDGKAPKLAKKSEHLVIGTPVAGRPGELRLAAPDAQIAWSPQAGEQVRAILAEAAARGAPPRITGIGRAFHVPGALPGDSETQIFLQTERGDPVSISIIRRPGEQPRWGVALSEIVDDAAGPPARNTLLWYRLACTLPARLPAQSFAGADETQSRAIAADYALVLQRLGTCERTRS